MVFSVFYLYTWPCQERRTGSSRRFASLIAFPLFFPFFQHQRTSPEPSGAPPTPALSLGYASNGASPQPHHANTFFPQTMVTSSPSSQGASPHLWYSSACPSLQAMYPDSGYSGFQVSSLDLEFNRLEQLICDAFQTSFSNLSLDSTFAGSDSLHGPGEVSRGKGHFNRGSVGSKAAPPDECQGKACVAQRSADVMLVRKDDHHISKS